MFDQGEDNKPASAPAPAKAPSAKFARLKRQLETPVDFGDAKEKMRKDAQEEQASKFFETSPSTKPVAKRDVFKHVRTTVDFGD